MNEHVVIAGAPATGQRHEIAGRLVAPAKMKNGLTTLDRAQHQWRITVDQHIGLDVSLKDTLISVRQDGKRAWRGKCAPVLNWLFTDVFL